jgi:hypothetical protein
VFIIFWWQSCLKSLLEVHEHVHLWKQPNLLKSLLFHRSRNTKGPFNDSVAAKSKTHAPTFTMFLVRTYLLKIFTLKIFIWKLAHIFEQNKVFYKNLAGLRLANLQSVSVLVRVHRTLPGRVVRPGLRLELRHLPLRLGGRKKPLQD